MEENEVLDFLKDLGIEKEGHFSEELTEEILTEADETLTDIVKKYSSDATPNDSGTYVINLDNSNEFGEIFTKLDKSDLVDEDQESSIVGLENTSIQYVNDDYTVTLMANLESDEYKMTVRKN